MTLTLLLMLLRLFLGGGTGASDERVDDVHDGFDDDTDGEEDMVIVVLGMAGSSRLL